jgi:hypothetical protein
LLANSINQVADPIYNAPFSSSYFYNFLVLPNGSDSHDRLQQHCGGIYPDWHPPFPLEADSRPRAELCNSR